MNVAHYCYRVIDFEQVRLLAFVILIVTKNLCSSPDQFHEVMLCHSAFLFQKVSQHLPVHPFVLEDLMWLKGLRWRKRQTLDFSSAVRIFEELHILNWFIIIHWICKLLCSWHNIKNRKLCTRFRLKHWEIETSNALCISTG